MQRLQWSYLIPDFQYHSLVLGIQRRHQRWNSLSLTQWVSETGISLSLLQLALPKQVAAIEAVAALSPVGIFFPINRCLQLHINTSFTWRNSISFGICLKMLCDLKMKNWYKHRVVSSHPNLTIHPTYIAHLIEARLCITSRSPSMANT